MIWSQKERNHAERICGVGLDDGSAAALTGKGKNTRRKKKWEEQRRSKGGETPSEASREIEKKKNRNAFFCTGKFPPFSASRGSMDEGREKESESAAAAAPAVPAAHSTPTPILPPPPFSPVDATGQVNERSVGKAQTCSPPSSSSRRSRHGGVNLHVRRLTRSLPFRLGVAAGLLRLRLDPAVLPRLQRCQCLHAALVQR